MLCDESIFHVQQQSVVVYTILVVFCVNLRLRFENATGAERASFIFKTVVFRYSVMEIDNLNLRAPTKRIHCNIHP